MTAAKAEKKKADHLNFVYVVSGTDDVLRNDQLLKVLDSIVESDQRQNALFSESADKVSLVQVLDELRTLPFLAEKRVVLLKNADKFISANRDHLEKYFDNPSRSSVLILDVKSWNSRTKLAKKLPSIGKFIAAQQPAKNQLPQYLTQYAKEKYNKNIANKAVWLLIQMHGDNAVTLRNEIDKLALYAAQSKEISITHVEALIGSNRVYNAFEIIDLASKGQLAKAIQTLRNMFQQDKSTEYTVVGAFAYHFRRMFLAKAMLEKGRSRTDVARSLRLWSSQQQTFFASISNVTLSRIGQLIQHITHIDYQIKTGQTNPRIAIEKLLLHIK